MTRTEYNACEIENDVLRAQRNRYQKALADLCDKVEKYARQETSRSILMISLKAAQQTLAGK